MGIPYIDAVEEADSELSNLCKNNLVYAVLTEDMDILTFGSPRIIRNLTTSKKEPLEIDLETVLSKLDLTYEQFIEVCVLFGCDYCSNVSDIKPNIIYKTYYKTKNLDETMAELTRMNYNIPTKEEIISAKEYFIKSVHNDTVRKLSMNKPNITKLIDVLVNRYGLIKYKIINKLNKLNEYYNKYKDL